MTFIAQRAGRTAAESARLASYSTALLGITTVLGALIVPFLADWLKAAAPTLSAIFYIVMMFAIWLTFARVFYMQVECYCVVHAVCLSAAGAWRS